MKRFDIITIFPGLFEGFLKESLISKAIRKRLISVRTHYLRNWTDDRHQTVDGKPYGGGPGLVMKIEPIYRAVKALRKKGKKTRVILFSPRGKQFTQRDAQRLTKYDQLVFICGRYEGVDERVAKYIADDVFSVGPYTLNGGEIPAMLTIEAVARLLPGFMHDEESQTKEDHAQYARPEVFTIKERGKKTKNLKVPRVLLSGDHAKIAAWRKEH